MMRSLTLPLLAATAVSVASHGLPELSISKRDKHNGGATNHFARSVGVGVGVGVGVDRLGRRQATVGTNIFNVLSWSSGGAYYANLTVGTPPQLQTVILDTGSSDLYFDASSAATCQAGGETGCKGGTFDPTASTTYEEFAKSPAFNTSFGDASTALGPYGHDVIGIGDVLISPVQFGVADEVTSTTGFSLGLLGLGYSTNEAVQSGDYYQNMPEVLKDAGVINSRLYSVFLNDASADSGTILFGGIDKSKFTGPLATVNFLPPLYYAETTGIVNQFITTVTAASADVGGNNQTFWSGGSSDYNAYSRYDSALPVLLDTGSTAWNIPSDYYRAFAEAFTYIDRNGYTSCANAHRGDAIYLEFGGKISIKVDASQFIVPLINGTTLEPVPYDNAGNDACLFLLEEADRSSPMGFQTLGDAILRSMYVVFDLDNGQASIAQAAVNTTAAPDVVIVEAGPSGVASAVSGVITAPANTWSIAAEVMEATSAYSVSTAASTIGSATGPGAVPVDAQVAGAGSGSGSGSGGGSATSSGVAAGIVVPGAGYTGFWTTSVWLACIALGAGTML